MDCTVAVTPHLSGVAAACQPGDCRRANRKRRERHRDRHGCAAEAGDRVGGRARDCSAEGQRHDEQAEGPYGLRRTEQAMSKLRKSTTLASSQQPDATGVGSVASWEPVVRKACADQTYRLMPHVWVVQRVELATVQPVGASCWPQRAAEAGVTSAYNGYIALAGQTAQQALAACSPELWGQRWI